MTPELNEIISVILIVLITHYLALSFGVSMGIVLKTSPDHNFPQQLLLVFIFAIIWPLAFGMAIAAWVMNSEMP